MAGPSLTPELSLLQTRLEQAGASLHRLKGAAGLAALLRGQPQPLWLEDHPWLREAGRGLEELGVPHRFAVDTWGPEAETAVTVGLGVVAETGSVLVPSGAGAASWLPFRARRHVVVLGLEQACLSLQQALKLSRPRTGMVTWLTGPTRTADIEKVLVLGAQGPRELVVALYQPEE